MSDARKLEIAMTYLAYRVRVEGIPNFNGTEFQERLQRTLDEAEFAAIQLTPAEALEFIHDVVRKRLEVNHPEP